MSQVLVGAFVLLLFPLSSFAVSKPAILPLPKGVPSTSYNKNDCILPAEWILLEKYIDSSRISISNCDKGVIPPSQEIISRMPYASGTSGSLYECSKVRENQFTSRQIDMFLEELAAISEKTKSPTDRRASCGANMLYTWAKEGAMSVIGQSGDSGQAEKDRMWAMAGITSVYVINSDIRQAAIRMSVGSKTKDDYIRSWFSDLSYMAKAKHDGFIKNQDHQAFVNTQFWRAYSMLPTAILNQDAALLASSKQTFLNAMKEIDDSEKLSEYHKGFLPRELERLAKSLGYHEFAAYPLVGMAVLSRAYGCDFADSSWRTSQLARLIRKTTEGWNRPQIFESAVKDYVGKNIDISKKSGQGPAALLVLTAGLPGNPVNPSVISFMKKNTGVDLKFTDSFYERLGGNLSSLGKAAAGWSKKSSSKLKASGLCGS